MIILKKFNILYKCLTVLLDDRLVRLAIYGNSFVCVTTNFSVHEDNIYNGTFVAELQHIKELIAKHPEAINRALDFDVVAGV